MSSAAVALGPSERPDPYAFDPWMLPPWRGEGRSTLSAWKTNLARLRHRHSRLPWEGATPFEKARAWYLLKEWRKAAEACDQVFAGDLPSKHRPVFWACLVGARANLMRQGHWKRPAQNASLHGWIASHAFDDLLQEQEIPEAVSNRPLKELELAELWLSRGVDGAPVSSSPLGPRDLLRAVNLDGGLDGDGDRLDALGDRFTREGFQPAAGAAFYLRRLRNIRALVQQIHEELEAQVKPGETAAPANAGFPACSRRIALNRLFGEERSAMSRLTKALRKADSKAPVVSRLRDLTETLDADWQWAWAYVCATEGNKTARADPAGAAWCLERATQVLEERGFSYQILTQNLRARAKAFRDAAGTN